MCAKAKRVLHARNVKRSNLIDFSDFESRIETKRSDPQHTSPRDASLC